MSSLAQISGGSPGDRVGALMRDVRRPPARPRGAQAARRGTKVLMLQPGADDVKVMGFNMMSGRRRVQVT